MAGTMNFRVDTPARRQEFRDYIDSIKDPQKKQMFEDLYQDQLKEWEAEHSENISEGKIRANDFHARVEGRPRKVRKNDSGLRQKGETRSSKFVEVAPEHSLVPVGRAQTRNDREAFRRAEKNESAINSAKAQDERHVQMMGKLQNTLRKRYAERPPDRAQIEHLKAEIDRQYRFHTQAQEEIRRLGGTPNKSVDSRARSIQSWVAAQEASAQKQANRAEESKQRASARQAEQERKAAERQGMAQSRESRREQRREKDQQFKAERQSKEREKDRQARAAEAERNRQFKSAQAEGFATARAQEREAEFERKQSLSEDRAALESFRAEEARQRHAERMEFAHLNEHYRRRRERRRIARAVAGAAGRGAVSGAQAGMAASRRQKKEQARSFARKRPTRIGRRIGDKNNDDMTVPILVVGGAVLAFMLLVGGTK